MAILTFDIETIPDTDALRNVYQMPTDVTDKEVVEMAQRLRRQEKGNDFFSLHLHRIVAISCLLRQSDDNEPPFKLFTLPHENLDDEAEAIKMFFEILRKYQPTLVSWNGSGFDLPVLHYRTMRHNISAPIYWNTNEGDYRWNNYINRYHERHTDLMDVLSLHQARACVPLDEFSKLCGLPGKIGVGGAGVWDAWQAGQLDDIRRYCEADVMLTYLLYSRFQQFRGRWDNAEEAAAVRAFLEAQGDQWDAFLAGWA